MSTTVIVSLGIDCTIAEILNKICLRDRAFPFDWIVTYRGIAQCIQDDFDKFMPMAPSELSAQGMLFIHHSFPQDQAKFERRIERFRQVLTDRSNKLIFLRRGHRGFHHEEIERLNIPLMDDLQEIQNLVTTFGQLYPSLHYEIVGTLHCEQCYPDDSLIPTDLPQNVHVHHLVRQGEQGLEEFLTDWLERASECPRTDSRTTHVSYDMQA